MNKEQMVAYFQTNFDELKTMVFNAVIWTEMPDKHTIQTIRDGLLILAREGDKNAAALYCTVAAFGDELDCFSKDVAMELVMSADAVDEYQDMVRDEFQGVVEVEFYDYLMSFPAIHFLGAVVEAWGEDTAAPLEQRETAEEGTGEEAGIC